MTNHRYEVVQLSVGMPQPMMYQQKIVETAFRKQKVREKVYLSRLNFDGDLQADQKNHGGPDKAVLGYNLEHYTYWKERLGIDLTPSSFGENITISGLDEASLCIGDVFELDGAIVQVSQPRKPCYKVAASLGVKTLPAQLEETGYTGFYFRVLKEGWVGENPHLTMVSKGEGSVSIAYINSVMYTKPLDIEALRTFAALPALAEKLKSSFLAKIEKSEQGRESAPVRRNDNGIG